MDKCIRRAWLVLGSQSLDLEDPDAGYFCTSLDLGYPDVRDVTNNRPDQSGIDDRTLYFGGRVVSADITALLGAGAQIDAVASSFAPFMVPSARPVLHYILDRPGTAERTLPLRGSGYSWPIEGDNQRDIQLQWVAADPLPKDPVVQTRTAWAGSVGGGRQYNLGFSRIYPAGGSGSTVANVVSHGDVFTKPLVTVYGPISGPLVHFVETTPGQPTRNQWMWFLSSFVIDAGRWMVIDANAKTIKMDDGTSVLNQLNWQQVTWPIIRPSPATSTWTLSGTNTSGVTQMQVAWQDVFLG